MYLTAQRQDGGVVIEGLRNINQSVLLEVQKIEVYGVVQLPLLLSATRYMAESN